MSDKLARMGVEVNAETEQLQGGLDQASQMLDQFEAKLQGLDVNALDSMLNSLEQQAAQMEMQLAKMDAAIEASQRKMATSGSSTSAIANDAGLLKAQQSAINLENALDDTRLKIDMVKNAIDKIDSNPINKAKNAFKDVGDKAAEAGNKADKSMSKSIKTIGKFGALLIGVRTIYSIITRATQSYIQENEALGKQINSMYIALGSLLGPAIQAAVNFMTQLVRIIMIGTAYFLAFLNAIFGFNFQINKSVKSTNGLNNSLKKTAKTIGGLSGIDELNVINSNKSNESENAVEEPKFDMSAFDISGSLQGLDDFSNKLRQLSIIIGPLLVLVALLAIGILALLAPSIGIAIGIGLMIAALVWVISVWDSLSEGQKTALKVLAAVLAIIGLIVLALWGWNTVQLILNGTMMLNPIGLIITAIGLLILLIVGLIVYWDEIKKAVIEFAKKAGDALSAFWQGFMNMMKTPFNMFLSYVNLLIDGVNFLIRALNSIKVDIPSWVPLIGGQSFGLNINEFGHFKYLASGGVTTGPTTAVVGEGRYNEAVIPLGQSPQFRSMKQEIADEVARQGGSSNGQVIQADIYLGDVMVGSAMIDTINKTSRLTGKTVTQG